ncbi:branched-chain amino acid ABC transporter permease [Nocardioides nitrophenolicus]|uniref:branched-chain amino acid ABC transporter permease n=1 Tax=Nocardioides nitrophenolicus TaxID=60489 RepID=UPI00195C66EC|nr:branched-chain amino acid ABC transporter permease [Nocardioides nitrophenolicus]MBM7518589.1 branched-chain amino acid transport system permease protein [Nocardioides nitrophenolicus]
MNARVDRVLAGNAGAIVVAALVAIALVPTVGSDFVIAFGFQLVTWIALALSWSLFSGNSGYASFGHGVFFGIGTYATAAMLRHTDAPFVVTLVVAGLAAALLAVVVGLAVFSSPRFAGDLFGLITLAMAFIVITVVSNLAFLDGGTGVFVREQAVGTWIGSSTGHLFVVGTLIAAGTALVALAASRSRWGAALRSIRDDEGVAESLGVPTYRYKVLTFAASAGLAGLAGAPQAIFLGYVEVGAVFTLNIPLLVIMMTILGGITRWWGPLVGAASVVVVRELLLDIGSPELSQIILGVVFVLVIALLPHGISGSLPRSLSVRRRRAASLEGAHR